MAELLAGWVIKKIADKGLEYLTDTGIEYLKDQVRWQTGMKEQLQRLHDIHPQIQAVVDASSLAQIRDQHPALDRWLWQLRDAVEEADDLLDEFEYLKHKEQLTRNSEETKVTKIKKVRSIMKSIKKRIVKISKRALKIDPTLKRLEEVVHKLVNVSADVGKFILLFENTKEEQQEQQSELYRTRETGASPTNNFIGRREEMEKIMQWLRNSSNEDQSHITSSNLYKNISLLSIVGHGGMGKTTLLRHVYKNVMENEFEVKMWVCVSTNFDDKRVITGMFESLKSSKCDLDTFEGRQRTLKSEVDSKKFLLVLDDIWEGKDAPEKEMTKMKWEKVFSSLANVSLGSKILITTRMDSVALMIADVLSSKDHKILSLGGMKDDECLELLNSQVFATGENPDAHKKSILKQIVKKVLGSPLATKVIGGVLRDNMNETYWTTILNSDIGSIEQSQNIFFPILRLSYMFLPKPLQSCFSFCSIFPLDHEFDKDDLIRMWIALNFIQPFSNSRETMEDIGERYFDTLVKKSFFEKFQNAYKTYYKMHHLLHELTQFVSARECCRVMCDEELSNCETIRHLFVRTDDLEVLRKITKFKKLRSLFLSCDKCNRKDFADVLSEIFKASSSIHLLFIDAPCQIPETIGDLIHLRYLNIFNHLSFAKLPRSICTLYQMNFIIYRFYAICENSVPSDFLHRGMNNLFNLRYVQLPWNSLPKMHCIWKPRPLQRLNNYFVKNEAGYRINELEHMNEICALSIYQLENVKDVEEACSAKLCYKGSLTELSLQWGDNIGHRNIEHSNLDEEVFDNLQPHNNLKQLTINAYMGTRSAIWMNNVKFISNLESITLVGCLEWQTLPPFGKLHFLKSLYLHKMPKVKSFDYGIHRNDEDCAFPSLEVLHIEDLDALEDWFDAVAVAANDSLFPCLTKLCLRSCPNLKVLPSLPPKLQVLKMDNIRWKGFSWLQDTSNFYEVDIRYCGDFPGIFSYVMATDNGKIKYSELIIHDPSDLLIEPLRNVTSVIALSIYENDKLVSIPIETEEWFLQSVSSLKHLDLSKIPLLKSLPDLPSSLEVLELWELKSLQHLPSLSNITSLKHLSLVEIPLLNSLPVLPPSLQKLSIKNLESLECLSSSLSTFSSLKELELTSIPLVKSLSVLPPSLQKLSIENLESLECMPSSLLTFSSLKELKLSSIPLVKSLSVLPPSLEKLSIKNLESLECLPSSWSTISSLKDLKLSSIPLLKSLPVLPSSLQELFIYDLESLECLPSSLSTISFLQKVWIIKLPLLQQLPDLPSSLGFLFIQNCHEELKKRYDKISGFDRDKLAHIPDVYIP